VAAQMNNVLIDGLKRLSHELIVKKEKKVE
jgi:hypothetical protein